MSLQPPEEPQQNVVDPGAHEMQVDNSAAASVSSDDHFSDAEEAHKLSAPPSPVPTTRVERVDDDPSYGEVPGTPAYKLRTQDAVPDEVELVPDGQRSRSTSRLSESDRPSTPGGTLIPKMIVERVDEEPAYGEVPGTAAYDMRKADAEPDEVRQAPIEATQPLEDTVPIEQHDRSESPSRQVTETPVNVPQQEQEHDPEQQSEQQHDPEHASEQAPEQEPVHATSQHLEPAADPASEPAPTPAPAPAAVDDYDELNDGEIQDNNEDDGFGDDFDDFEEGAEAGEDDDFGDFDDGFQEPEPVAATPPQAPEPVHDPLAHLPNLTFDDFDTPDDILKIITPHLHEIFPEIDIEATQNSPTSFLPNDPILTDRSASLWSQLVAPPPLQPPNWIRSRIRRLFLVSLGVPVDLDEILPASKQKKLILPNINLSSNSEGTPRSSMARLRKEGHNASNASIGSTTSSGEPKKPKKKEGLERRGPAPPPDFDANAASLLSSTTDTAMTGYSDEELREHVERLEGLISSASQVLEYWLQRKDSAVGDKEAFEGVIENLVGFVRKNRDSKVFK